MEQSLGARSLNLPCLLSSLADSTSFVRHLSYYHLFFHLSSLLRSLLELALLSQVGWWSRRFHSYRLWSNLLSSLQHAWMDTFIWLQFSRFLRTCVSEANLRLCIRDLSKLRFLKHITQRECDGRILPCQMWDQPRGRSQVTGCFRTFEFASAFLAS